MTALFIFGLGYTAQRVAAHVAARGWHVAGTGGGGLAFDDESIVRPALAAATHVLSSVPPDPSGDAVLARYGDALGRHVLAYLSSTGVYGDAGGAWVDETAPVGGRRPERDRADRDWQARGARVYRLPGIYGPDRSPVERVLSGAAHRVDVPGQVFSRVHVDDIVAGVVAGFDAPAGVYNLADDLPCSQNDVVAFAAALLGLPPPPVVALDTLSPMARGFYGENRRVANGRARRVLGWRPRYPTYREGLSALAAVR